MQILSTESLEELRSACLDNPKIVEANFEETIEERNLILVPFNADLPDLPTLKEPEGTSQEANKDLENCKLLGDAFSGLTAALATDERLWTTLCFQNYSSYALKRWNLENARSDVNHVQNHWFAKTARNRMRDNAIGRLWWMAHIAKRVSSASFDEVLENLFFNSDYRSSLLERNSSANAINVVTSILSISQKAFGEGIEFKRENFRNFMKRVDFIGKRTSLPSLSLEELEKVLTPIYAEAYEVSEKALQN